MPSDALTKRDFFDIELFKTEFSEKLRAYHNELKSLRKKGGNLSNDEITHAKRMHDEAREVFQNELYLAASGEAMQMFFQEVKSCFNEIGDDAFAADLWPEFMTSSLTQSDSNHQATADLDPEFGAKLDEYYALLRSLEKRGGGLNEHDIATIAFVNAQLREIFSEKMVAVKNHQEGKLLIARIKNCFDKIGKDAFAADCWPDLFAYTLITESKRREQKSDSASLLDDDDDGPVSDKVFKALEELDDLGTPLPEPLSNANADFLISERLREAYFHTSQALIKKNKHWGMPDSARCTKELAKLGNKVLDNLRTNVKDLRMVIAAFEDEKGNVKYYRVGLAECEHIPERIKNPEGAVLSLAAAYDQVSAELTELGLRLPYKEECRAIFETVREADNVIIGAASLTLLNIGKRTAENRVQTAYGNNDGEFKVAQGLAEDTDLYDYVVKRPSAWSGNIPPTKLAPLIIDQAMIDDLTETELDVEPDDDDT